MQLNKPAYLQQFDGDYNTLLDMPYPVGTNTFVGASNQLYYFAYHTVLAAQQPKGVAVVYKYGVR